MSFQIENQESLPSGIKRILHTELEEAISSLESIDKREGVHEARKSFKKVRAVLRIVRDQIGSDHYRYENTWFRDAGRQLSSLRDATALLETLEVLQEKYPKEINENLAQMIRTNLSQNRDDIEQKVLKNNNTINRISQLITEGKERIQNLSLDRDSFKAIKNSIGRIYSRGYKAMNRAIENPSVENLHLWRKLVKYLWYMMLLLRNTWPTIMDAMATQLSQLGKLLGTDHDLAVFQEAIEDDIIQFSDTAERVKMENRIHIYRQSLQEEIFQLGKKIYRAKPKEFVKNLETYWKTWRKNTPTQKNDQAN